MNHEKRWKIFNALKNQIKEPKTELIYKNSFELLIAVILSAQTTDIQVNRVIKKRRLLVVHIVPGVSGLKLQDAARAIQHNQTDDKANHQVWIT